MVMVRKGMVNHRYDHINYIQDSQVDDTRKISIVNRLKGIRYEWKDKSIK